MKELANAKVSMKHYVNTCTIKEWEHGDPFPVMGSSVGVDSETELITDSMLDPPVVVLGVFDYENNVCWIVYWYDIAEFITELCRRDIHQYYFNVGFDEQVLDNTTATYLKPIIGAADRGLIHDMQIRIHLHELAKIGFIRGKLYSLEGCSMHFLNIKLDKGDPNDPENSARLTFKRHNADGTIYRITEKQAVYLAYDCISTFCLSKAVPEQPTEIQHTKGMMVLAHISKNGFGIDPVMHRHFVKKLEAEKAVQRQRLLDFGFPDPDKDAKKEAEDIQKKLSTNYVEFLKHLGKVIHEDSVQLTSKASLTAVIVALDQYEGFKEEYSELAGILVSIGVEGKDVSTRKAYNEVAEKTIEQYNLEAFAGSKRPIAMRALLTYILENINNQLAASNDVWNMKDAIEYACEIMDEHPDWIASKTTVGPVKFFQDYAQNLLDKNPKLELERTPKSKRIKLTLKDMWRLEDLGITDQFLNAYTKHGHCQKYLSTYMKQEYIKSDGKVHPRFTSILRTGRTSCTQPNCQNLPSRDAVYGLKYMFVPPKGAILCATDFSFIELCAFAQTCYTRFGVSVMRDVINAGIDPHRWFAGVMTGMITPDLTRKDDKGWIKELTAKLIEQVPSSVRQKAKAANFGFPGGLGTKTFYRNCRESGIVLTMKEADSIRNVWLSTFKEMAQHMRPVEVRNTRFLMQQLGFDNEEGDEEDYEEAVEAERDGKMYICTLPCGQVRTNCTFNAACNTQFQGTTAIGAKLAGWNLLKNGYGDRIVNFVHDEYLYWLYPEEVKANIPIIEKLMLDGMRNLIPDVKIGVESSCMLHWDKKAKTFDEIKWTDDGLPAIDEPDYVKQVYDQQVTTI